MEFINLNKSDYERIIQTKAQIEFPGDRMGGGMKEWEQ